MTLRSRLGAAWRGLAGKASSGNPKYDQLAAFAEVYGSRESKSGQAVTASTALQVSTVLACVRVLADGIAQSPLKLYRERPDGRGADPASDHPLYAVLHRRPNPWQTSFAFRETLMFHLVLCGNFFAFKNRAGAAGEIRELIPIDPGRVEVRQNPDMSIGYRVRGNDGHPKEFPAESIWHVRGPSWNSWMGMEAVQLAREAIGLSMAIEADQAGLYKNGLRTSGTYSVEGNLSPQKFEELSDWIKKHNAEQPGAPLILDMAAKYLSQSMTGVDAQTLESRKFQVEDTCRPFRVIPLMAGHSDKTATYASAEQMFIAHVVHGLVPHGERIEQSVDNDLLSEADRAAGVYAKFNFNALMRGAAKDQAEYFAKALGAGGTPAWMSPNEVRALLEMNPDPDPASDKLPRPSNPATPTPPPAPGDDE